MWKMKHSQVYSIRHGITPKWMLLRKIYILVAKLKHLNRRYKLNDIY